VNLEATIVTIRVRITMPPMPTTIIIIIIITTIRIITVIV